MDLKKKHCIGTYTFILATSMLLVAIIAPCFAEETVFRKLARKMQNPVSDRISFSLENNFQFGVGLNDDFQNLLRVKSLYSFNIGKDFNLINRTILPLIDQPELTPGVDDEFGLGDINTTFFLMPRTFKNFIWGIGPIISLPTATDEVLGTEKWGLGPSAAVVSTPGRWVYGAVVNNIWSVAGDSNRKDVNAMALQPFIYYNFPSRWYVVTSPIIRAVWKAERDERWVVPIGGGVGKVFKVGNQSMNAFVQGFYNIEKPNLVADWSLQLQIQFLYPK
jgi:hypothetical protein